LHSMERVQTGALVRIALTDYVSGNDSSLDL